MDKKDINKILVCKGCGYSSEEQNDFSFELAVYRGRYICLECEEGE